MIPGARRSRSRIPAAWRLGQAALWVGAVLGVLSIVLAVASFAFGVQPLVFRSGSMSPDIKAGALALAKDVPASQVEVGDVVSVVDGDGRRVTHRVTATTPSGDTVRLTLKGDANAKPDSEPYAVTSVDRVLLDVPYLGYLASWMAGPVGMFLAGLLVAAVVASLFVRPRGGPRGGRRIATDKALTAVIAAGLLAPVGVAQGTATGTLAAFSDTASFEAGVIGSHRVRGFDLAPDPCVNDGTAVNGFYPSIKVRWIVADSALYEIEWNSAALRATKVDSTTAAAGTIVETPFTGGVAGATSNFLTPTQQDTVLLTGTPKLRTNSLRPTTDWRSETGRTIDVDRSIDGRIRCAGAEVPPDIAITSPTVNGGYTYSGLITTGLQTLVNQACNPDGAACGSVTASGTKTVTSVQYELQRQNLLGTQCWNGVSTYTFASCQWKEASITAGSGTRHWTVPGNGAYSSTGNYVLRIRATDSAGEIRVTTLSFRVNSGF